MTVKKIVYSLSAVALVLTALVVARRRADTVQKALPTVRHSSAADVQPDSAPHTECSGCNHTTPGGEITSPAKTDVALVLADIPGGRLKAGLMALGAEEREEALDTLAAMNFQPNDVESVRVDPYGGVYYVCTFRDRNGAIPAEGILAAGDGDGTNSIPEVAGAGVPISDPPFRHSRPGAGKVLYLDFNGHVISGTRWNNNSDFGNVSSWDCKAWSIDSDRTTFSATEQARIIEIWERVAEDYAPFDVDVTTEQPVNWTSTTGHALITPRTDKNGVNCPHYGYGGIAYVGVFGNSTYSYSASDARSPAWCIDYTGANCAEVISHELGHNMGLSHDGTSGQSYYPGHVNGGIRWGPLMGTGYNDDVSQWSKGEYYDANQTQDDLAIIAGKVGYRPDDHGDNNASASPLGVLGSGDISDGGIIGRTNDPDVFSFLTGSGTVVINANAYKAPSSYWGANLDIILELYDDLGSLIATNNPELDVDASISVVLTPGQYFIHVKPTGVGDPMAATPTGYTSYGCLGQYWLSGMVSADADDDYMPNEWEFQYFGSITGAVAELDFDGDGANNLAEYVTGYDPTDPASVFGMDSWQLPATDGDPTVIYWPTKPGRLYSVGYSPNLQYVGFTRFGDATDLPPTRNSYTDTVVHAEDAVFYRVDVRFED